MSAGKTTHKYEDIFKNALSQIENAIDESVKHKQSVQLSKEDFKHVGGRDSYSFNLVFLNGIVDNNIGGSAVSRDLARILDQNSNIVKKMKGRCIKFNMDKGFTLWVTNK